MKLSIIIPTFNESRTLAQLIKKVQCVPINKEIIIVDDGSTDNTKEILKDYKNHKDIFVIYHKNNRGKGSAIRTGRKYITGDIVIIQDADLETEPMDYIHLVKPIIDGKTKVVYGSRLINNNKIYSWKFHLGGRFITFITNILYNQNITDEPTCYKIFDSELFKSISLNCTGFEFCPEITAKVSKMGIKIIELPMQYYPRNEQEGKKLKTKDGFIALWTLIKYKFIN